MKNATAEILKAATKCDLQKVRALIQAGVKPANLANSKENAITQAARGWWGGSEKPTKVRIEVMRELIDAGCPVQGAALRGTLGNPEIVRFLIEKGADVNAVESGQTALGAAIDQADRSLDEIIAQGRRSMLAKSREDDKRAVAVIRMLIKAGADVNKSSGKIGRFGISFPATPLVRAARQNHPEIIRLLCEAGAQVDAKDPSGTTPLLAAIEMEYPAAVKALVECGANVNLTGKDDVTPLALAKEKNNAKIIRILEGRSAAVPRAFKKKEDLLRAAEKGDAATVEQLLAEGSAPDERSSGDFRNCTALALAAEAGHVPVIESLLAAGASVDAPDTVNRTPLFYAAKAGKAEAAQRLIAAGANLEAMFNKPYDGPVTALFLAAEQGHAAVVEILLKAGANACHRARDGRTALSAATDFRHTEVVRALIPVVLRNPKAQPILDRALWRAVVLGDNESTKLLVDAGANPLTAAVAESGPVSALDYARRKSKKIKFAYLSAALKKRKVVK